jgi:hypothetical protein
MGTILPSGPHWGLGTYFLHVMEDCYNVKVNLGKSSNRGKSKCKDTDIQLRLASLETKLICGWNQVRSMVKKRGQK